MSPEVLALEARGHPESRFVGARRAVPSPYPGAISIVRPDGSTKAKQYQSPGVWFPRIELIETFKKWEGPENRPLPCFSVIEPFSCLRQGDSAEVARSELL